MLIVCDKCGAEFDHPSGIRGRIPKYCPEHRVVNRGRAIKEAKQKRESSLFPSKKNVDGAHPAKFEMKDLTSEIHASGFRTGEEMGFGYNASLLWDSTIGAGQTSHKMIVCLVQACRITDRLDQLDEMIRGGDREWTFLKHDSKLDNAEGPAYRVVMNGIFRDEREASMVLKNLIGEMRMLQAAEPPAKGEGNTPEQEKPAEAMSEIEKLQHEDELAVRRATANGQHTA